MSAAARFALSERTLFIGEFSIVEFGDVEVPVHLVDEVECIAEMLAQMELHELRLMWRGYVDDGGGRHEGDVFVVRCAAWHRAMSPKFKAAFGLSMREMAEVILQEKRSR